MVAPLKRTSGKKRCDKCNKTYTGKICKCKANGK